jgi:hypothetical protein
MAVTAGLQLHQILHPNHQLQFGFSIGPFTVKSRTLLSASFAHLSQYAIQGQMTGLIQAWYSQGQELQDLVTIV